ncbi:phage polarity suppression protein [Kosakonia cowanii]|nr:phage polarity suppression protein [Kosakonia cowanii]WKW44765.1 phage polarity suppression protein [Kosakonia cowanii]
MNVKKWKINQAVCCFIRPHENEQRVKIRDRLNDFMQEYDAELAAL